MKTTLLAFGLLLGLSGLGCSESNTGDFLYMTYDLGPGDMPSVDMSGDPAPPVIGAQLDRAGRPLINTILTNPFDLTLTGTGADTKARMQDAYNASVDPAGWVTKYGARPWVPDALAFWDGMDGTCGNQYTPLTGTLYTTLGNILAFDALLIDTTKTVCNRYLALETGDLTNCGGRQPDLSGTSMYGTVTFNNNVIDTTINLLIGIPTLQASVLSNGITKDADGTPPDINTKLPFLLGPS